MYIDSNKYRPDIKILPETYVAMDLELTGDYKLNYIIEVAALKFVNGQLVDEFTSLVKPPNYKKYYSSDRNTSKNKHKKIKSIISIDGEDIYYIDEFIENLTGISNDMLYNANEEGLVINEFYNFIGDMPLVGHGMANDILEIKRAFKRVLDVDFNNLCIDTFDIAEFAYDDKFSLINLCNKLGIDNINMHRARSDAYRTHLSYIELLRYIKGKYGQDYYSDAFFQWMEKSLLKQNRILKNRVMTSINSKNWSLKRHNYLDEYRPDLTFFNSKFCLSNRINLKSNSKLKNLLCEYKLNLCKSLDPSCDYYITKNSLYDSEDIDKQIIKKVVSINKLGKSVKILALDEFISILENFNSIDEQVYEEENKCFDFDFSQRKVYLYNDFNYEAKEYIADVLIRKGAILLKEINKQTDYIIVGEGFDKPVFYESRECEILLSYLALGHNIRLINEKKFWDICEVNKGDNSIK